MLFNAPGSIQSTAGLQWSAAWTYMSVLNGRRSLQTPTGRWAKPCRKSIWDELIRATHWAQAPLVGAAGVVTARPPEPEFPPAAPAAEPARPTPKLATTLRDGHPLCAGWPQAAQWQGLW